jgi:hypothetical protein
MTPEELKKKYARAEQIVELSYRSKKPSGSDVTRKAKEPPTTRPALADDPNTVPFGRYRGHSIETLLTDPGYVSWIRREPNLLSDLRHRYPKFAAALIPKINRPLSPRDLLLRLSKEIDAIYAEGGRIDLAKLESQGLAGYGTCLDVARKMRSIMESLGDHPTEEQEREAVERISRLK